MTGGIVNLVNATSNYMPLLLVFTVQVYLLTVEVLFDTISHIVFDAST